jgi:hypothetical protein
MASFWPTGFTPQFLVLIVRVYVLIKGIAGSLLLYGALPLFRNNYGLSGADYQTYVTICLLPWTMKPLVGAIVDAFPIAGYRKRYYAIAATLMGAAACTGLAWPSHPNTSAGLLFVASFGIMMIDLIYEGEYASIMAFGRGAKTMPSFVWACVMGGSVVGALAVGPLGDRNMIRFAFPFAAVAFVQLTVPLLRRPLDSFANDKTLKITTTVDTENLLETRDVPVTKLLQPREWVLCIAMAISSVVLIAALYTGENYPYSTLVLGTVLCVGLHTWAYVTYGKHHFDLWACNIFMFIAEACYIDISGAQDYWFTATAPCVENGPAFSLSFYTSVVTLISGIVGLVTALAYNSIAGNWSYRSAIQFAIVFQATSCFTDIILALRWNVNTLGISDKVFFLLGDAVISPAASMLKIIPMAILTSKLVQRGKETLTYSLLAGFQNLGQVYAKLLGLASMAAFGIHTTPPCNFTYYPALLFFAHMLGPLLAAILAYLMVPGSQKATA